MVSFLQARKGAVKVVLQKDCTANWVEEVASIGEDEIGEGLLNTAIGYNSEKVFPGSLFFGSKTKGLFKFTARDKASQKDRKNHWRDYRCKAYRNGCTAVLKIEVDVSNSPLMANYMMKGHHTADCAAKNKVDIMSPEELDAYAGEDDPGCTVLYHQFAAMGEGLAIEHPGMSYKQIWAKCRNALVPGSTSCVRIPTTKKVRNVSLW